MSRRRAAVIALGAVLALPVVLHHTEKPAGADGGQGQAVAWGDNDSGALGDGTTIRRPEAVVVEGLSGVKALSGSLSRGLALLNTGTVRTWGNNEEGQQGDATTTNHLTPGAVPGVDRASAVAAGGVHSLILLDSGKVLAFGSNRYGQLGIGTVSDRERLVEVPGLSHVRAIAAGKYHSLALLDNGKVMAWGLNDRGQLGIGVTDPAETGRSRPVEVVGLTGVKAISSFYDHSLALLDNEDRTVKAWGDNSGGVLGNGVTGGLSNTPVAVLGLTDVEAIAAGGTFSLALRGNGKVKAWGDNTFGQLGLGVASAPRNRPTDNVVGLSGVRAIAAGIGHGMALVDSDDDIVKTWGINNAGQLGDGLINSAPNPTPITVQTTLAHIGVIAAGHFSSYAAD
ncbi:RCC1 domain-containing protein [Catellatospora tritici]|uniref:RCC1 domain-containing protein n=1 Tax=Catellatospora tritici TaxID=2851566 RepID=UPI001C2D3DF5|nr:cell wall anchor protein [Catellatospora tritici]MBV1853789.1 cell wall anchor protein [Catellatospora tritici]